MNKNMFPSLIKSLISPRTKKIANGIQLSMSTSFHTDGDVSIDFMGLQEGDVQFILKVMSTIEKTVFIPQQNGINWLEVAVDIYKIIPKDTSSAPAFKQIFAYLIEAMESKNVDDMKAISKFFVETVYIKDFEDNEVTFLLPENINTTEIPTGKKKKYYC